MNHRKKILIVCIALVILVGSAVAYYILNKPKEQENHITEMVLKGEGQNFEVLYDLKTGQTLLRSKEKTEVLSVIARNPLEVMRLPKIKTAENTVKGKKPISTLTFSSSQEESAKYLNYLKEEGYEVIRKVHTPQYIDEVLQKGSSSKRVVIFKDSIMVGDLKGNPEFTNFERYLKKYK